MIAHAAPLSAVRTSAPAIVVTRWARLAATDCGQRVALPWTQFVEQLRQHGAQPFRGDHKHPGWSPATFHGGRRGLEHVERVHALMLDYDKGPDLDTIASSWGEFAGVLQTTRKHTPHAPRCRIALPLARPVSVAEYARLWQWARARARALGQVLDEAPKDPSRFWYVPGSTTGYFELRELAGDVLDPDQVFRQLDEDLEDARQAPPSPPARASSPGPASVYERARRYIATMPAAISGQRGHDAAFNVALVLVQGFALDQADALQLLERDYNPRCQPAWSEKELQHKIASAAKAQRVGRGWLLEDDRRDWRKYTAAAANVPPARTESDQQSSAAAAAPALQLITAADVLRSAGFKRARRTFPTGIARLDELIGGGLKSRQQSVVAAPTGTGKTQLAGTLMLGFARSGRPILWVCTELDVEEQGARFAALALKLRGGSYTPDDLLSHVLPPDQAAQAVDGLPLYVLRLRARDGNPFTRIHEQAIAVRDKHGEPPLIVVDYLQKLAAEDEDQRRVSTSNVSERLLELAQDLDTHMLAISSVARALYNRTARKLRKAAEDEDPRDWLAVGKESGDIEYDGAVIAYLDVADERSATGDRNARLIVAKCRQGTEGFVGLRFHGPTGLFVEDEAAAAAMRPEARRAAPELEEQLVEYLRKHQVDPPSKEKLRTAIKGVGVTKVDAAIKCLLAEGIAELRDHAYTTSGPNPRRRTKKVVALAEEGSSDAA